MPTNMHWDVSNRKDPSQTWLFGRVFAELQHAWPVSPLNPMETAPLDPSLPGVRLLQSWIREQLPLSITVAGQEPIEGRLIWQDPEFLAIERMGVSRPVLINRRQISVIRSLG